MATILRKIGEVRDTFEGISKDVNELLTMAELSVPVIEDVVEKVKNRISQVEKLFAPSKESK